MNNKGHLILNDKYSIKEITDLSEFEGLSSLWDKIAEKNTSYKPYLSFNWYRIWLKHFLDNHQLLILLVFKNGILETIAPLVIKQRKFKGIFVKKVELIGNAYSPIQTFLFKESDDRIRSEMVSVILHYFSKINRDWDIIDLQSIPEEEGTLQHVINTVDKSGFKKNEYCCFGNWYSDGIQYSSDIYFKNRTKNLRASIKKNVRNARNKGKLKFEMIIHEGDIEKNVNRYFGVYSRSWKRGEKVGPNFLIDFIKYAGKEGWLRLGLVSLDNVTIGVGFAIVCDGFAYFEKTAYEKNYEDVGAGSIWLTEMMKYVIDVDKVSAIDFLRGDDQYKRRWVSKRRERKGLIIFKKNLKGYYLYTLLRYVLPVLNRNEYLRRVKAFAAEKIFKTMLL